VLVEFSLCGGGVEEVSRGVVSPCRDMASLAKFLGEFI
jgi:hypothetical protein